LFDKNQEDIKYNDAKTDKLKVDIEKLKLEIKEKEDKIERINAEIKEATLLQTKSISILLN
jgi:hypothetical protein